MPKFSFDLFFYQPYIQVLSWVICHKDCGAWLDFSCGYKKIKNDAILNKGGSILIAAHIWIRQEDKKIVFKCFSPTLFDPELVINQNFILNR